MNLESDNLEDYLASDTIIDWKTPAEKGDRPRLGDISPGGAGVSRKDGEPQAIQRLAARKLNYLDGAGDLDDLRSPPGNHLEPLKDDRTGQHSIRINDQWRICFVWRNNSAYDVEIVDYH